MLSLTVGLDFDSGPVKPYNQSFSNVVSTFGNQSIFNCVFLG